MAYSFTTSGAVPNQQSAFAPMGGSTTPQAKALNTAMLPGLGGGSTSSSNAVTKQPTPIDFSKLVSMPGTSGILKSQTINQPDGSSIVHTYDTATTKTATPQTNAASSGSPGIINPSQNQSLVTPQVPSQQPVTFPGILGTVASQGSQPSQLQNTSTDIAKNAAETYNKLNTELSQSRQNEANALKTNYLNPIPIGDQEGRARAIRDQYLAQQNAIASEAQGATNLFSPALSTASATQGQQFGAAQNAAGLAQPSPAAYGQTVFNPASGEYTDGGGLPPEVMRQYAQMAANGQIASIPASITGNTVLSAQLNAAAKAINPNFTPITSAAQGSSAADLTGQASAIQAQANGAEANFDLMLNIAKQGGVNDANVPILNTLQNNVNRGLTSSAAVANFQSLIQSVRSQYASILGGGTVTVEALQEAQSLIPNDISISALESLGQNLKSDAQNRVAGLNQQIQALGGGANATGGTSTASSGGQITWANIGD